MAHEDTEIVATNRAGVGIDRKRLRELIEMNAHLDGFTFTEAGEAMLPPPVPNETGLWLTVERPGGGPSLTVQVDSWPKGSGREFTPAERRSGPATYDRDWPIFER